MLLRGLFVRLKLGGAYQLRRIAAATLQGGDRPLLLQLEGVSDEVAATALSGTNPLVGDEDWRATGKAELDRLAEAMAGGGGGGAPATLDLHATARATWRRTVLLGWAPDPVQLMNMRGIG